MELSIVATIYNDSSLVQELCNRVQQAMKGTTDNYELILVNDGSSDASEIEIEKVCQTFPHVKGISLSKNYGQQIAMSAGMQHAQGDFVLIMDGDLQNPPEEIPALLQKCKEGYDLVYTISKIRNSWMDSLSSSLFWWSLKSVFRVDVVPHQLMMKIMSRAFLNRFNSYSERCRSVVGIVQHIGMKTTTHPVTNGKRFSGRSHYSFLSRFNLMIDLLISFSVAPLTLAIQIGMIIFLLTLIGAGITLYRYFHFSILPGYTSTILLVSFFGSLNLLFMGFFGRYLAAIYQEVKQRPLFHIQRSFNLSKEQ